jgi:hypothetical protein
MYSVWHNYLFILLFSIIGYYFCPQNAIIRLIFTKNLKML